MRYPFSISSI
jgi:hypothetical protein